ncbi:hypothetical protein EB001_17975 [bacterium]|nr:hypothetical protein [bacterium]
MDNKINLSFTLDEVNAILGNLGKLPYENVFPLIENIRNQALPQLEEINKNAEEQKASEEATEVKAE